jgi:hypothetical protein
MELSTVNSIILMPCSHCGIVLGCGDGDFGPSRIIKGFTLAHCS